MRLGVLAAVAALASPALAHAQGPVDEGAVEQSCKALQGGSAGAPDEVAAEAGPGIPATWPAAPAGLLPRRVDLRTSTETFNRRYEFATRGGNVYGRDRGDSGPWRRLPLPLCFAGRVTAIALDDDEMIALDSARRVYTMDNALKSAPLFDWTSRWGTPVWLGPGYTLPDDLRAWSWSVVSPLEDGTWTDPAGNQTPIGAGKVSHIWGLRAGGQRLTFWDPWLPLDQSYEMCGPHRGRFKAVNMSASGSFVFVIGRRGDLFTREYDFDLSGHDAVFFKYSYEDQRGKGNGAPIQLPAAPWVEQPKVPGAITSAISIHKVGKASVHRMLRVEGTSRGRTGYWERDAAAARSAGWRFRPTDMPLTRARLSNPRARHLGQRSRAGRGRPLQDERRKRRALRLRRLLLAGSRHGPWRRQGRAPAASPRRRASPAGALPRARRRSPDAVRSDRAPGQELRDRDRGGHPLGGRHPRARLAPPPGPAAALPRPPGAGRAAWRRPRAARAAPARPAGARAANRPHVEVVRQGRPREGDGGVHRPREGRTRQHHRARAPGARSAPRLEPARAAPGLPPAQVARPWRRPGRAAPVRDSAAARPLPGCGLAWGGGEAPHAAALSPSSRQVAG